MQEVAGSLVERALAAWLVERPAPTPGPGEVLLRVDAASICGTDLNLFTWDDWAAENLEPPRVLGHELAGTVIGIGRGVTRVKEGDRLSASQRAHRAWTYRTHLPATWAAMSAGELD